MISAITVTTAKMVLVALHRSDFSQRLAMANNKIPERPRDRKQERLASRSSGEDTLEPQYECVQET